MTLLPSLLTLDCDICLRRSGRVRADGRGQGERSLGDPSVY